MGYIGELNLEAQDRVATILNLDSSYFDLKFLITEDKLKEHGFLSEMVGSRIHFMKFRNGVPLKEKVVVEEEDAPVEDGRINLHPTICTTYLFICMHLLLFLELIFCHTRPSFNIIYIYMLNT